MELCNTPLISKDGQHYCPKCDKRGKTIKWRGGTPRKGATCQNKKSARLKEELVDKEEPVDFDE